MTPADRAKPRRCLHCDKELAWQSGYERWVHARSGLPRCELFATPKEEIANAD